MLSYLWRHGGASYVWHRRDALVIGKGATRQGLLKPKYLVKNQQPSEILEEGCSQHDYSLRPVCSEASDQLQGQAQRLRMARNFLSKLFFSTDCIQFIGKIYFIQRQTRVCFSQILFWVNLCSFKKKYIFLWKAKI